MAFTSVTAKKARCRKGALHANRKFKALGYPNLKKATAASLAKRARLREMKETARYVVTCSNACPCRRTHRLTDPDYVLPEAELKRIMGY